MNRILIVGTFAVALFLQACNRNEEQASSTTATSSRAAPGAMGNMPMPSQTPVQGNASQAQIYKTTGQITAVTGDSVTISHESVPALGWPAMTMTFKAPDTARLAGLQNGAPVEFSFRQEAGQNIITSIKPR